MKAISIRLGLDIVAQLDEVARIGGITRSEAIRRAIKVGLRILLERVERSKSRKER